MSYKEEIKVNNDELNVRGELRLLTLFNYIQRAYIGWADDPDMNIGMKYCLPRNLSWFIKGYDIDINTLPKQGDVIEIEPRISKVSKVSMLSSFEMYNKKNKDLLLSGVSQLVLIGFSRERFFPKNIVKEIPHLPIPEKDEDIGISTITPLKTPISMPDVLRPVSWDDLDFNHHMNNAMYPIVARKNLPQYLYDEYDLKKITIYYDSSAAMGDTFKLETKIEEDSSQQQINTVHRICSNRNPAKTFARIASKYQKNRY